MGCEGGSKCEMKSIDVSGKTVEEAIQLALKELAVERDRAVIEVLEEPSRGFLGLLGGKQARVRVVVADDPVKLALDFLGEVLVCFNLEVKTEVEERDNSIYITFRGKDLGVLIGRKGETLDALQYLLNLAVSRKTNERTRFILNVEDYRQRREESLIRLARQLSEKARRTGRAVTLEPMSPYERRIIHTALQADSRVYTFSEGEEPYRKVVISPKNSRGRV